MESIIIERRFRADAPLTVDNLYGTAIVGEEGAHVFRIRAERGGEPFAITGQVSARFLAPAGITIPIAGSAPGGVAEIVLPVDCYLGEGRFVLSIYVTDEERTVCVYCAVGTVRQTGSDQVVYPTEGLPDLTDLVDEVQQAIASVPADYSDLLAAIAPTFSTTARYAAGMYVWRGTALYRFRVDHAPGNWASTEAYQVTTLDEVRRARMDLDAAKEDRLGEWQYLLMPTEDGVYSGTSGLTGAAWASEKDYEWSFEDGAHSAYTGAYYMAYTIPEGTEVLRISGYRYATGGALYGFYDGSDNLIDKFDFRQNVHSDWMTVKVPPNATKLVLNVAKFMANQARVDGWSESDWHTKARGVMEWVSHRHWVDEGHEAYTTVTTDHAPRISALETALAAETARAVGWRSAVEQSDWDLVETPGVYRGSTQSSRSSAHAPFSEGGLYSVLVMKTRVATTTGATTQIAWLTDSPTWDIKMRTLSSSASSVEPPDPPVPWSEWQPITKLTDEALAALSAEVSRRHAAVPYSTVMRWELFTGETPSQNLRVKHAVMGGGRFFLGLQWSTAQPYRIAVRSLPARLDDLSGETSFYDIQMVNYTNPAGQPVTASGGMGNFKDSRNGTLQVAHMAYYKKFLYVAVRAGGEPDPDHPETPNSFLAVIDTTDMSTTKLFAQHDRVSTLTVDERASRPLLIVGERRGRMSVYDIGSPGNPVEKAHIDIPGSSYRINEYQHSCLYQDGNGDNCVAFGSYVTGACGYRISVTEGNAVVLAEKWHWGKQELAQIGADLNTFAVAVSWPYAYATVSPLNAAGTYPAAGGRNFGFSPMGVAVLDLTDLTDRGWTWGSTSGTEHVPRTVAFYDIPEDQRGSWSVRVGYDRAEDEREDERKPDPPFIFSHVATGDPQPTFIKLSDGRLYVNNEDRGICVYGILPGGALAWAGRLELGCWPRYFELYRMRQKLTIRSVVYDCYFPLILAGGEYDYQQGKLPAVTALAMPVMSAEAYVEPEDEDDDA